MGNIYVVYQHTGYKKHPKIKNKLIIDEKAKKVVQKIFTMYSNGHGSKEIVNILNKNRYLSPTGYRKTRVIQGEENSNYKWNEVTICNMLKNEVYIGNTVQNKKTVVSYKVKKIKTVEKENQIRVNDTHEPIIDKEVFEKVQCILAKKGANTKFKHDYLLRGILYCQHCKRKLQIVMKKGEKYTYITCSNHKKTGCYPLNINYNKFEKYIIDIVKGIIKTHANKDSLYAIYKKHQEGTVNVKENYEKEINNIKEEICEINNTMDKMYIDKLEGVLQKEDFARIARKAKK